MPTYEVTSKDGTTLEVDGPRPPTEDELKQIFSSNKTKTQTTNAGIVSDYQQRKQATSESSKSGIIPTIAGDVKGAYDFVNKSIFPKETFEHQLTRSTQETMRAESVSPQSAQEELSYTPKKLPVVEGVAAGIDTLAGGFTSPLGIATLGMGSLPASAQRAISLAFAAQMISQAPEQARQLGTEFGKPPEQRDTRKIAQLITEGAGTVGFAYLAAKHGLTPEKSLTPLTDTAVKQTVETKGEQNAIHQEASPVLPDVRTQPVSGEGQVPVKASGAEAGARSAPTGNAEEKVTDIQNVRPAIKTMDGNIVVGAKGDVHDDIIAKNGLTTKDIDSRLFVDANGNEISREQLAQMGVKSDKPVEGAHASDLADAQKAQESQSVAETKPAAGVAANLTTPPSTAPEQSPTAMKYKLIDQERAERGLEPLTKGEAVSDQATMDKAMAEVDKNPEAADDLVKELNAKPRPISDVENHVLLLRKIDLKSQYNRAAEEVIQAANENSSDLPAKRIKEAQLEDKLTELEMASRASGSERGRGLRALQVMANEDFSLASLVTKRRVAKGGKPLTESEHVEVKKVAEDYKNADEKLKAHLEGQDPIHPKVLELAKKIIENLDRRADSARLRLKTRMKERARKTFAGVDPSVLLDLKDAAEIGASHLAHGIADFAEWSAKVVEDVGDWVKPHLDDLFKRSQGVLEGVNAPDDVKRVIRRSASGSKVVSDAISKVYGDESRSVTKDVVSDLKKTPIDSERQRVADAAADNLKKAQMELDDAKEQEKASKSAQDAANKVIRESAIRRAKDESKQRSVDAQREKETASIQDRDKRRAQAASDKSAREEAVRKTKQEAQQRVDDAKRAKETAKVQEQAALKAKRSAQDRVRKLAIESAKAARKALVTPGVPAWKRALMNLESLKKRTSKQISDLENKMAKGDYSTPSKPTPLMDREAMELQAKRDRVVKRFKDGQERLRLANRKPWEKVLDFASDLKRFNVLTSLTVIPKLLSAGAQRIASMPLEELIGEAWSKVPIVSKIAAKAPLEGGGLNVDAEMRGFGSAFSKGMKDAYDILKTGASDLDVMYGKSKASYSGETRAGSIALELPGRIHGAIKSPVKRVAFERAAQILGEYYAKQGLDVTDPNVKTRIAVESYKAANRSIFLEDNRLVTAYKAFISTLEGKEPNLGRKAVATGLKIALPVVRVPTNIAVETMRYALGAVKAPIRITAALAKGMENLKPEEADAIMRDLKKGSIGAAILALGYYNADNIGGYYQPNKKQKEGDVKYGTIRIFGEDVPAYLLHNPLLETLQIGATIRHVADSRLRKKDTETQGIPAGIGAAAYGVSEEIPFVREMSEIDKLRNPYTRGKFLKSQATDLLVPQIAQQGYKAATNILNSAQQ